MNRTQRAGTSRLVVAGIVTALVGTTSSFAVVLAGLTAVGASPAQAASGLAALCALQGAGSFYLATRHRVPVVLAWSTPGAALLAASGAVEGGWPAAVGAFVLTGVLLLATAAIPVLGDAVARIPPALAQAMLAGVLVPLCLAPVHATLAAPGLLAPTLGAWLLALALRPRLAAPAAIAAALVTTLLTADRVAAADLVPHLVWTTPTLTLASVVGIAVPLWVVTMAAQNVPGAAVLTSFGYRPPWRSSLGVTGALTVLAAPWGGHALNLAAITAALSAGPEAGPDPARRWIAARTSGLAYLVLALLTAALSTLVLRAPGDLLLAAAGLALVGTLGSSLTSALREPVGREAAVVTLLVALSGTSLLGISSAFWALVAGGAVHGALALGRRASAGRSGAPGRTGGPTGPAAVSDAAPGRETPSAATP